MHPRSFVQVRGTRRVVPIDVQPHVGGATFAEHHECRTQLRLGDATPTPRVTHRDGADLPSAVPYVSEQGPDHLVAIEGHEPERRIVGFRYEPLLLRLLVVLGVSEPLRHHSDDGSIVGLDPWPDRDPRRRFARVEPIRDVDLHMEILPLREIAQPL